MKSTIATRCQREGRQIESDTGFHGTGVGQVFNPNTHFLGRLRFLEPGSRASFDRQALGQLCWPAISAVSTAITTDLIAYSVPENAEHPAFDEPRLATRDG